MDLHVPALHFRLIEFYFTFILNSIFKKVKKINEKI